LPVDLDVVGPASAGLAAFLGNWALRRRINDARSGQAGRFEGTAHFVAAPGGLAYSEEGQLWLGAAPPVRAERRYFWSAAGGRIAVDFADGRPFHSFDPRTPDAEHDCPPDFYRVRYDFGGWPRWRAEWTVTGPRKSYVITGDYMPG
jgi:hypothetical protein